MWELDHKEGWAPNNWCFWIVVLEKTLESPLDCKEIKSVNHKGNQYWIFTERTYVEAEAPVIWQHDINNISSIIRKDPDAGKDWRQEKEMSEDEMVGFQHWLNGHEFWVSFRRWWETGKPGVLRFMGSQRVGLDWATELNWADVWMWELDYKESWVLKNWCFWNVVLGLLRVPWTARRSNQSTLKEISPEHSLEGLMLKL